MEVMSNIRCGIGRTGDTVRRRLYGKVLEPFDFSWDMYDVSSGTYLVLDDPGKQIDEEISVIWNNRAYPVWVKEIDHPWPPALKEPVETVMVRGFGGYETGEMDLEEGEI
ncbi:hypothetical protein L1987_64076 [Smallanthus sonchifolius]|uniref:Uncharacterized protein n=1 Tax=Smallanthus sonchifolius TaxID=185202 RepID=A0ACB9CF37_9ASTR|nr:hypothetical protein L1987_64076 [Smallanthus sonchifolius]